MTTQSTDSKKTVVVLGAPRSGTSVTSGVLRHLGVDFGAVRPPDPLNPTGYFEDRDFNQLTTKIFKAAGPDHDGLHPPTIEAVHEVQAQFDDEVRALIDQKLKATSSTHWGWKQPNTCFQMELFLPHLPSPSLVVVLRNPLATARSVVRYAVHDAKRHMYRELTLLEALRLSARYEEAVYAFVAAHPELPHLFLSYEDLVESPVEEATRLASFLAIDPGREALRDIESLVLGRGAVTKSRLLSEIRWRFARRTRGWKKRIKRAFQP